MIDVLILMGGRSSEHDVSRSSAEGVLGAIDRSRFHPRVVAIRRDGVWLHDGTPVALCPLSGGRAGLIALDSGAVEAVDVVFPVLHGPFGEDGTVQGLCETVGVPYVGAGVAASAVAMDKALFKQLALQAGLPVAEAVTLTPRTWEQEGDALRERIAALGLPVFTKPARLGSSIGITRVATAEALDAAIREAFLHDDLVLFERGLSGREVEVGVLGDDDLTVSPPGQIAFDADWYDFETKYQAGRAELMIPAPIPDDVAERTRELAARAYRAAGCEGMGRIDFFVTDDGQAVVSELNTIPGFTPTSAYPSLMAAAGVPYTELVTRLIELAMARHQRHAVLRR